MVLRMYLFALPAVALFISTLIFPTSAAGRSRRSLAAVVVLCFALLGVFQFTRYGNERLDRFTTGDRAAVQALYRAAPVGTTVVGAANLPWRDRHYADYTYKSINRLPSWGTVPDDPSAVVDDLEALAADADADVHVVITRSMQVQAESFQGRPNTLKRVAAALRARPGVTEVYANPDGAVFRVPPA